MGLTSRAAEPGAGAAAAPRLKILTTIPPIYSWVAAVAGTEADVSNLLPADVGPHDFQFSPSTLRRLQQADLIVANGLGLEDWLAPALTNSAPNPRRRVLRISDGLESVLIHGLPHLELPSNARREHDHDHDHDHNHAEGGPNPHVWLDPVHARHAVTNILRTLGELDPSRISGFERNARAYLGELEKLDADYRNVTARLTRKGIVTFHDAFPYLTRRYGLELVGVIEEVPGVAPSPKYLAALSRVIRNRKVGVLFTEPQFEPRLVKQLGRDLGVAVAELDVLETGATSTGFYLEGMRRNLRALESALR